MVLQRFPILLLRILKDVPFIKLVKEKFNLTSNVPIISKHYRMYVKVRRRGYGSDAIEDISFEKSLKKLSQ